MIQHCGSEDHCDEATRDHRKCKSTVKWILTKYTWATCSNFIWIEPLKVWPIEIFHKETIFFFIS